MTDRFCRSTELPLLAKAPSPDIRVVFDREEKMSTHDHEKVLTENEVKAIRFLVARKGERAAAEELHVSRNSLQRLMARLPAQRGTVALVRQRLTSIGATRWSEDGERTTPV